MDGFIGIDLGTSGCRACVINQQGDILAEARVELPESRIFQSTHVEQNPTDWWQAVLNVLDQVLHTRSFVPKAISIDGTSSTLLLCDQQGEPLTPALMYNDSRSVAAAVKLKHIASPDSAVHSASSALAKLMHLQDQHALGPKVSALHQADWIAGKLINQFCFSDENNALKLGYDPVQGAWPEWLDELGLGQLSGFSQILPQVVPVGRVIGVLTPQLMQRWQCQYPVEVIAGTTDSNAAAIAAGVQQTGDAVTSLGSTLVLKVVSDKPLFNAEYGIYSHRLYGHWLVGGASNTGGQVLAKYFSIEEMQRLSERINPQQMTGLNYYPLIKPGERFPVNDAELEPQLSPKPDNDVLFFHALLEGIARIEQRGYQLLKELGAPYPTKVMSSGGGAKNGVWQQIRHHLLNMPVSKAKYTEAAYGSALIAAQIAFNC